MPLIAESIAKRIPSSARMPMLDGFIYEPRAFWSVGRVELFEATARPPNVVQLNREHFYNGEKYPITLLYACVCAPGYVFDTFLADAVVVLDPSNFRNDAVSQMEFGSLRIAARQRQHYAKNAGLVQMLTPRPRWEPSRQDVAGNEDAADSSLYNVFRWDYDAPMVIPARGDLEYELSTWLSPGGALFPDPPAFDPPPHAQIMFQELGTGPFGSNARISPNMVLNATSTPASWTAALWGADGFGSAVPPQNTLPGVWNAAQRFTATQYARQNKTSDGSVPVTGVGVMIDQQDYDTDIAAQAAGTGRVASLGTRIGTRARMRHGGTGAWWWREGAPLALVSPHRTVAQVFEFRRPLTLQPGDSLEVELTFPTAPTVGQSPAYSINQLGVSVCGHAAIES